MLKFYRQITYFVDLDYLQTSNYNQESMNNLRHTKKRVLKVRKILKDFL